MKITVIYGTERKGSTYHIAQQFISQLSEKDQVVEFFLPKDMPKYCRGCFQCFEDYKKCPDYTYTKPVLDVMENSDLLIFTSPVYVMHVTGQMKTFLDHFGFQWMSHQPNETMFHKQALIITTAAGAGTKSTAKDIKDSMDFWGVAKTYILNKNVAAASWDGVSEKKKLEIEKDVERIVKKIKRVRGRVKPTIKVKGLFYMMKMVQKKFGFNPPDVAYWKTKGWLKNKKPW